MFKKILIANRGEIARRIIAAAREIGISTLAIYSNPDANALFVKEADEAFCLEGIEAKETYLDVEKVLKIALENGVDAIHPGYGFLSENADFAEACEKNQIKFIGPKAEVIRSLGSKTASKEFAFKAKVPTVPGIQNKEQLKDLSSLQTKIDQEIGYPLLIKASAGGGGKGMRVVWEKEALLESLEAAKREALTFFKDDTVFIERYIQNPKHIEVQILGDEQGNLIHLFERECSVQRRHQKMVEESPSPSLNPELRQNICHAALRLAKEAGYFSAGTVEFLLDKQGRFYFLEVNTRLQVEHPITECVTGIDLVKAQIAIAAGHTLPFSQEEITQRGHAIECRLYAEDPENNFLPSEGKIATLKEPLRPGLRIDSGIQENDEILPYYDPMLAKLIAYGANRKEALQKMIHLIKDYVLLGSKHNLNFLLYTLNHPDFTNASYHTHSVGEWMDDFLEKIKLEKESLSGLAEQLCKQAYSNPSQETKRGNEFLKALKNFRN